MRDPRGIVLLDARDDKLVTLPVATKARIVVDGEEREVSLRLARGVINRTWEEK